MPNKERFAWVWLITMVVTYSVYFAAVFVTGETTPLMQIGMFTVTTVIQVVIIGTASAVIAIRHEGGPSSDERDQMIEQKATRTAYQMLICAMVVVGCLMPFNNSGWKIFHAAVLSIAVVEIVRHGLIVLMYRRGINGE